MHKSDNIERGDILNIIKNQKGSVLIEFVLVFPVFLCLVFGAVTIGIIEYDKMVLSIGARSAGREVVSTLNTESGVDKGISFIKAAGIKIDNVEVSVTAQGKEYLAVARGDIPVLFPGFSRLVGADSLSNSYSAEKKTSFHIPRRAREDIYDYEERMHGHTDLLGGRTIINSSYAHTDGHYVGDIK